MNYTKPLSKVLHRFVVCTQSLTVKPFFWVTSHRLRSTALINRGLWRLRAVLHFICTHNPPSQSFRSRTQVCSTAPRSLQSCQRSVSLRVPRKASPHLTARDSRRHIRSPTNPGKRLNSGWTGLQTLQRHHDGICGRLLRWSREKIRRV